LPPDPEAERIGADSSSPTHQFAGPLLEFSSLYLAFLKK
jgi:hypothetical protein